MPNKCEKLSSKLIRIIENSYWPKGCVLHWCPACDEIHAYAAGDPFRNSKEHWTFDGNAVAPTLTPSMNLSYGDYRCHYHLRAGMLEYLNDCTHEMKGQTVALPDIPDIDTRVMRYTSSDQEQ